MFDGADRRRKSRLSLKISRIIDTPVISADSMQIYKGFDIGTAKPAPEELAETKHYMINIAEPEDYFSSYDYAQQAESIISDLETENKIPFISGGTGFYIETLLFPNDFDNSVDFEYRKELDSLLRTYGKDALVKMLQETDPKTAEKSTLIIPSKLSGHWKYSKLPVKGNQKAQSKESRNLNTYCFS